MSRNSNDLVNKICRELASEVVKRERDPGYRNFMDREECVRKLANITNREVNAMDDIMEKKIEDYVKSERSKLDYGI
jgi:hypothetical protein